MKPFRYEPKAWFTDHTRRELDLHEGELRRRQSERSTWQAWEMCRATLKSRRIEYIVTPLVPCVYVDSRIEQWLCGIMPPAWKNLGVVQKIGKTDYSTK